MAFAEPPDGDLSALLGGSQLHHSPEGNLLRRSTLGLTQLFTEVSAAKSFGGTITRHSGSHSASSTGRLDIGESSPTLSKRYRLVDQIGEGSFSQIYKALDNYTNTHVAIKVLKVGFELLGDRETKFLQYLHGKEVRGAQHFVHVFDTFRFEGHFCIVQRLYDSTLMSLLNMSDMRTTEDRQHPPPSKFVPSTFLLHQPRVVRTKFLNNATPVSLTGNGTDQIIQLRRTDINKLRRIATSLLSALCMMRREGTIHADIKPENCFVQLMDSGSFAAKESTTVPSSSSSSSSSGKGSGISGGGVYCHHEGLHHLPDSFEIRLGDFGNSIHISEINNYYVDFEMQTLPYRAPEVLLGVPFNYQIDMWSLGILLVEVCIGKPLFVVRTREELFQALRANLTTPPAVRFAGGMYSELLELGQSGSNTSSSGSSGGSNGNSSSSSSSSSSSRSSSSSVFGESHTHSSSSSQTSKVDFAAHLLQVKSLLQRSIAEAPAELVHFLAGLLYPDPDYRLTPLEAMQHPFIAIGIPLPLCLIQLPGNKHSRLGAAAVALNSLRSQSAQCKKMRNTILAAARRTASAADAGVGAGIEAAGHMHVGAGGWRATTSPPVRGSTTRPPSTAASPSASASATAGAATTTKQQALTEWSAQEGKALHTVHSLTDAFALDFWDLVSREMKLRGHRRSASHCEAKWAAMFEGHGHGHGQLRDEPRQSPTTPASPAAHRMTMDAARHGHVSSGSSVAGAPGAPAVERGKPVLAAAQGHEKEMGHRHSPADSRGLSGGAVSGSGNGGHSGSAGGCSSGRRGTSTSQLMAIGMSGTASGGLLGSCGGGSGSGSGSAVVAVGAGRGKKQDSLLSSLSGSGLGAVLSPHAASGSRGGSGSVSGSGRGSGSGNNSGGSGPTQLPKNGISLASGYHSSGRTSPPVTNKRKNVIYDDSPVKGDSLQQQNPGGHSSARQPKTFSDQRFQEAERGTSSSSKRPKSSSADWF